MSNQELIQSLANQEKTLLAEYAALDVTQNPERGYELLAEIKEIRKQKLAIGSLIGDGDVSVFMNYSELNNG